MEKHFASLSLCCTATNLFPPFVYLCCSTAKWWQCWNTCNNWYESALKSLLLAEFSMGFTLILCLNLYVCNTRNDCHGSQVWERKGSWCGWEALCVTGATEAVPINWGHNLQSPLQEKVMEEEEGLKSMNSVQQLYTYILNKGYMKE